MALERKERRGVLVWALLFGLACNGALVAGLLLRSKKRAGSRMNFAGFFKCRIEDVAISLSPRESSPARTPAEETRELEKLRAELRDDVIVSPAERRTMANRVGLAAFETTEAELRIPGGVTAELQRDNFLTIRYALPGRQDATHTLLLVPGTWLQKDL